MSLSWALLSRRQSRFGSAFSTVWLSGFPIGTVVLGRRTQHLSTTLHRAPDPLSRSDASMENLAVTPSFTHAWKKASPNAGSNLESHVISAFCLHDRPRFVGRRNLDAKFCQDVFDLRHLLSIGSGHLTLAEE